MKSVQYSICEPMQFKSVCIKAKFLLILSVLFSTFTNGQQSSDFTLAIKYTSAANRTLGLGESYFLKEYKAATLWNDTAISQNGKFIFKGNISYPTAFRLYNLDTLSAINHLIFIDTGYQEIILKNTDNNLALNATSPGNTQREYEEFIRLMGVANVDNKISPEKLALYIQKNPNSYVALFALINQVFNYRLLPEYIPMFGLFGNEIKKTKAYKYFISRHLNGKKIPDINLKDGENKDILLSLMHKEDRYTLIEFWFTGCVWCIKEMKDMKASFNEMNQRIQIISICTDNGLKEESKQILNNLNLPWKNFWDFGGKKFGKYLDKLELKNGNEGTIYPTNILLDSSGHLIARDIDFERWREYLTANKK